MKPVTIAARAVALAGGLRCAPTAIGVDVWQAHLVKHPLGVYSLRSGQPWNHEGWDATRPPVVTADERARLIERVQALELPGVKCGVRELRGGRTPQKPDQPKEPCYLCKPPLLHRCAGVLNEPEGVGSRYGSVIFELLEALQEDRALEVPRLAFTTRLVQRLNNPEWIERGVVLGVGLEKRSPKPMARIARGDGTRADFYLNGTSLVWRTTYRVPQLNVNTRWNFLLDQPAKTSDLPLSDVYVVPRGWWEAHD